MNRLTTKEMVREFEEQKDPIQLYKEMDWYINSFTIPIKEFLNEMNNQKPEIKKRWTIICLFWIVKLSSFYCRRYFDDRNKKSCEVSNEIYNNFEGEFPEKADYEFEYQFVEQMAKNHRTLQQNFSRLVFKWFNVLAEEGKRPYIKLIEITSRQIESLPYI